MSSCRNRNRNNYKSSWRPLTLIIAFLAASYGMFVAHILSNNPCHDLLFQSPPPHPDSSAPSVNLNQNQTLNLGPPYAVVNESCKNIDQPDPPVCLAILLNIPSAKYVNDPTQLIGIIVDKIYNSTLTSRFKLNHHLTVHAANLSANSKMCLRQCEECSQDLLNFMDQPGPELGTLETFLGFVDGVHSTCLDEIDDLTDEGEKRRHGYQVMKEFAHSLFDELFHLECLGLYFTQTAMMSKLKLTELKPMPLIVTQYKPNPKHLLSPSSKPTASACGILCFFSWLTTTVLSSARLRLGLGL
ncbi:hypothetical protein FCV25MIE_17037 [Fagus crenata]